MTQPSLPTRTEIPESERWDTASVYASALAWEEAQSRVEASIEKLQAFQGRLGEGAEVVADWFTVYEPVWLELEKIHLYASLFHHADTSDQRAVAMEGRARALFARVTAVTSFAEPELLELGHERLRQWLEDEPRLRIYGHYFDQLERQRAHIRSAEVEEILGQLADPFFSATAIHGVLTDADLTFAPARSSSGEPGELVVAQGTIDALVTDADREVRRSAFESYADAHLVFANSMAACLTTCAKQHALLARVRGYSSCLDAALSADNIPTTVFYSFIDAFRRHLPTWHRYWRLRRKAMKLDRLHVYDLKAPLSQQAPQIGYEQAIDWICEGMKPLGEDYVGALRRGATEARWIDARPNLGKRAGAFSTGVKGTNPFVLMSFTGDVFSLSTLAHELGHSMHSYLTWQSQPLVYSEYSIFVAEVASNFNQALVRRHLLATELDRDVQIALLEEALSNFHRYFFVMPTLARFELELHERTERGEGLNAEVLNRLMRDLFAEGYGDEVVIDDERVGITWAQFPTHLYANFYVYQYGTGISAAQALADLVEAGEPGAVERYLGFLRTGGSRYPIDQLRDAGVDLTTTAPVDRAFEALATMIDRYEALILS